MPLQKHRYSKQFRYGKLTVRVSRDDGERDSEGVGDMGDGGGDTDDDGRWSVGMTVTATITVEMTMALTALLNTGTAR